MRIGIVGAMLEEVVSLSHLLERGTIKREKYAGREYTSGFLHGVEIVLVYSRIGKVAVASTVTTLIQSFSVDMVCFTGVAGGVDPSVKIGDIVVGTELVQHDLDASPLPQFRRFEVPLLGETHFSADARLVEMATVAAKEFIKEISPQLMGHLSGLGVDIPIVHQGVIASGDQFIASLQVINDLRREINGLLCIEMEGAALAQVCYEWQVPYVVIRAISDNANSTAHVDFMRFVSDVAAPISEGIVTRLIQQIAIKIG